MLLLLTSPNQLLAEQVGHCLSTLLHIPYHQIEDGELPDGIRNSDFLVVSSHPLAKASDGKDLSVFLHQGQDQPRYEGQESFYAQFDLILDQSCLGTTGTIELLKQFYVTKLMQSRSVNRSSHV